MTKPVLILGAGGHARVLIEALRLAGCPIAGIVDADRSQIGKVVMGIAVIGTDERVLTFDPEEVKLVNGIGSVASTARRKQLFQEFKSHGYRFAPVVHPSAIVASDAQLDEGTQVMAGVVIQVGVRVGVNCIINTRASVDHDCIIGAHVHVAPGVTISGEVRIEDDAHIGTGATLIQGIRIGSGSIVGAGSVVVRNVSQGVTVYGVPAREVGK
jgi:UDP-perosamine 4-acetyltransferase